MPNVTRIVARASRLRTPLGTLAIQPRRFAHGSYGNEQSGQEQGTNEVNPMRHMEHPGPEAPSTNNSAGKSANTDKSENSNNAGPAIHQPKSAAEDENPDVRKHNEDMSKRADKAANQLAEEDNKVDKKFWQGDKDQKK